MKAKILIIEDEAQQRSLLSQYLKQKGFHTEEAATAKEGLEKAETKPDVILLDWKLPDGNGIELLKTIKKKHPLTQVVMITAFGTIEMAVEALKLGAYHYLTKPINLEELEIILEKAIKEIQLKREVEILKKRLQTLEGTHPPDIIAESHQMKGVLSLVSRIAPTDATVLITGESGTGKEVIASLIHKLSMRKNGPFIKINCAAIPENLLESELFGYEKGAFTGATKSKPGLFEEANGGTIFLDEIGEMPLNLQAKLLRVLQERRVRRLGSSKEKEINVRVITATNRNLEKMVQEGSFREDLYWRLNVVKIHIPPLRERRQDILPLANHFLTKFSQKYGKNIQGFSKEAVEFLLTHPFPGNVRELENMIERAVILSTQEIITKEDLTPPTNTPKNELLFSLPLPQAVELLEKTRIEEALKLTGGNKTQAAKLLGISERVLRYKVSKYGITLSSSVGNPHRLQHKPPTAPKNPG